MVKLAGLRCTIARCLREGPAAGKALRELAPLWKPYIETCTKRSRTQRAMFEATTPSIAGRGPYPVLWNTFKRITASASADEKAALYVRERRAASITALRTCLREALSVSISN
jgi:L-fuconolactonase